MIVDCSMYINILVQFIDTTHVAFLSFMYVYSIFYSPNPTINYILYGRTMRTVHKLIILLAFLILLLLLLFIVIHDGVGTYDEMIIMDWDWYADDDVYIVMFMFVSICSSKDNYYTIIPSIYNQFGDSVDCSI